MGKTISEGQGEIQEALDVAHFATGLGRQLYGLTIASERPAHSVREYWHPLGPVAVVTAFNFPASVWSWNALVGAVVGDSVIWKSSSQAPLTAVAVTRVVAGVLEATGPSRSSRCWWDRVAWWVNESAGRTATLRLVHGIDPTGRHVAGEGGLAPGPDYLELG